MIAEVQILARQKNSTSTLSSLVDWTLNPWVYSCSSMKTVVPKPTLLLPMLVKVIQASQKLFIWQESEDPYILVFDIQLRQKNGKELILNNFIHLKIRYVVI